MKKLDHLQDIFNNYDYFIIDLWGDSEQTYQKQISPDGYIRIERLGPIYVNGLEIGVAKKKINAKISPKGRIA